MEPDLPFRNRTEAGRLLVAELAHYKSKPDVVVLGLTRGGVPVAAEVATALQAPLDVIVVRKLGVPFNRNWQWAQSQEMVRKCWTRTWFTLSVSPAKTSMQ